MVMDQKIEFFPIFIIHMPVIFYGEILIQIEL